MGPAIEEFGAEAVADAYCEMITLQMEQSFRDDLLKTTDEDAVINDFAPWISRMTPAAEADFEKAVLEAAREDKDAKIDVWSLTFYDAAGESSGYMLSDESATLNRVAVASAAEADVDESTGQTRLLLTVEVTADLNLIKSSDSEPYLVKIGRRVTLGLTPNPDQSDGGKSWLIDSWNGKFDVDAPRPA